MKLINFISFNLYLSFLFFSCSVTIDGPDTIKKYEAEKKIKRTVFIKAIQCGYNTGRAYIISDLGNDEYSSISSQNRSKYIVYLTASVDLCLEALAAAPCPIPQQTPTGNIYWEEYDPKFISTIVLTRIVACTLQPVSFWNFSEPLEGRVY
ncbi:MAG: hypothetical protein H7A25_12625 [Leptospiraceae bacterium]|nr:hypothetical protein [Leptospiraceae bacterium]MCP5500744.1 hypothetical protein [Leptospiraceae bacterium]